MEWNDKAGFHYSGKDKRGVSKWVGSQDVEGWVKVLRGLAIGFLIYGGIAGIALLGMLIYALLTLSWSAVFNVLFLIAFTHTLTFGGVGLWARQMRQHIRALATPDQISEQLGMTQAILQQLALEKGIKPRINLNGLDYYNPADFDNDAVTLLRGTTQPQEGQEVLLRPANDTSTTPPEQLLRIPNVDANTDTQRVFVPTFPSSNISSNVEQQEIPQR